MKTQINHPTASKINFAALFMQVVALLAIFDVIPMEAEQPIIEITMLVGPALIQIFRTWFTKP